MLHCMNANIAILVLLADDVDHDSYYADGHPDAKDL